MINRVLRLFLFQVKEKFTGIKLTSKKTALVSIFLRVVFIIVLASLISRILWYVNFTFGVRLNAYVLAFLLFLIIIITFISALASASTQLFNKNDNEFLLSFPVTPTDIFASKILLCFVHELLSSLSLFLPVLLGFGLAASGGIVPYISNFPLYIVMVIVGTFILPFLSLAISLVVIIPIQYIKMFVKKRLWTSLLSLAVVFGLIFWLYSFLISIVANNLDVLGNSLATAFRFNNFVVEFSAKQPFMLWLADMITGKEVLRGLSLIIVVTIVLTTASLMISRFFYFKIALASESSTKSRTEAKENKETKYTLLAIIKKDITEILRNSNGIFENFAMFILLPFFIYFVSKFSAALSLRDIGIVYMLSCIIMLFGIFTLSGNTFIAKSISREGPNLYILKTSPVHYKTQMYAKIITANTVAFFLILISSILFASVTIFAWWQGILVFLLTFILNLAHSLFSYELELKHPITNWYDSNEVKNSKNASRSVSVGFGIGLFIGYYALTFLRYLPQGVAWLHLFIMAIGYLGYRIFTLNKRTNYLFKRMEV